MKSLIVYFSQSGNTASVAINLSNILKENGEVKIIGLEDKEQKDGFLSQCKRAFLRQRAEIDEVPFDVSGYDLVCVGSPVWAFNPAPAILTYLNKISGLDDKKAVCYITYGSGLGRGKALEFMRESMEKKGAKKVYGFEINQARSKDIEFLKNRVKEIL